MDRPKYVVYFNKWNKHVTIHRTGYCHNVGKRVDPESHGDTGGYEYFGEEGAAREYAKTVSKNERIHLVKDCWHCKRNGGLG